MGRIMERIKEKLGKGKNTMNLKEILLALIDGKKIRHKGWGKDEYIYYYNGKDFIDENWEFYKEPTKPIDNLNKKFKEYRTTNNYPDFIMFEHIVKYLNEKENERK